MGPPVPPGPHRPVKPAVPAAGLCAHHCSAAVSNAACHDHCYGSGEVFCHDHCYGALESNCHDHCFGDGDTYCHDHCYGAGDSACHDHCYGVEDVSCQDHCYAAGATTCQNSCFTEGQGTGTPSSSGPSTGPPSSGPPSSGPPSTGPPSSGPPSSGPPSTGPPSGGGGGSGGGGSGGGGGGSGGHLRLGSSAVPSDAGVAPVGVPTAPGATGLTIPGQTAPSRSGRAKVTQPLAGVTPSLGRTTQPSTRRPVTRTASASTRVGSHGLQAITVQPATLLEHFIQVIPWWIWLAFGIALAAAAVAGVAAIRSGRRARARAGEVALVTADAITDPLTGILNRRGFTNVAQRELERAQRYGHPLALAFVDVRGLKTVNDTRGHQAGDELAVMLTEQGVEGMTAVMRRVRAQLPLTREALGFDHDWDLTIGMAVFPRDGHSLEDLLAAADRRLYMQRGIKLR